jgi:NitT/TauT family transport system substrate-binding protein
MAVAVGAGAAGGAAPTLTTVNVSYVVSSSAVPLFVGVKAGFYAAQGLDVHSQPVAGSAAAVAGVTSGQLQFATGAAVTLVQAYASGIPIEIIGPEVATTKGVTCLLAQTGTKLAQVHSIGLNTLAGSAQLANEMWLHGRGIDHTAIHYLAIPTANMVSILASGSIDAAVVTQPFVAQALAKGGFSCLGDDGVEYGPYGTASAFWFTSQSFARQNPQIVKAFSTALLRSNRYSATHLDAEIAADEQLTGTPLAPGVATQFFGYPTGINLGVLQRTASYGFQYGLIQSQVTVKNMLWPGIRFTRI